MKPVNDIVKKTNGNLYFHPSFVVRTGSVGIVGDAYCLFRDTGSHKRDKEHSFLPLMGSI